MRIANLPTTLPQSKTSNRRSRITKERSAVLKNIFSITILIAALSTGLQSNAEAQKRRSPPVPRTAPFDISREALPPNYQGLDIEAIFRRLSVRSSTLAKREFETSEQHRQRLKMQESTPVLGSLTVDDVLVFSVDPDDIVSVYDADKQSLQIGIAVGYVQSRADLKGFRSLSVTSHLTNEGSYIATNAYGTKIRVTSRKIVMYELAYDNPHEFAVSEYLPTRERVPGVSARDSLLIDINMDSVTAFKAKQNLHAVVLTKLIPPYTSNATYYDSPTFDNPVSYYQLYHYLLTHLEELWLYDKTSGNIYAKVKTNTLVKKVAATAEKSKQRVWLQLEDGKLIEVDEAWEQGDIVWYKKGNLSMHIESKRVTVIRKSDP
jgi:hypothetical protein